MYDSVGMCMNRVLEWFGSIERDIIKQLTLDIRLICPILEICTRRLDLIQNSPQLHSYPVWSE